MRLAQGASWASCELRHASCASESAVPHVAKERSTGGMWWPRARSPRWLSPPQSSRSCTVRGICVFARGGVTFLSSLLFAPLRSTSALRRRPLSLGMPAARAGLLPASVTCVSRAYSALRTTFFRRIRGLRRVFVVSRSCRARVASSSLSLLACSARQSPLLASLAPSAQPALAPNTGNMHAARRRGVAFAPAITRREPQRARARALFLRCVVCAVCGVCGPSGLRPLATGQLPCCVAGLPGCPLS
jgi:hypothetical protein